MDEGAGQFGDYCLNTTSCCPCSFYSRLIQQVVLFNTYHPRHWHPTSTIGNNNKIKVSKSLTGQPPPNDEVRDLLALPARLGGIALTNPTSAADVEFSASTKVSDPLKKAILQQNFEYPDVVVSEQVEAKGEVRRMKCE